MGPFKKITFLYVIVLLASGPLFAATSTLGVQGSPATTTYTFPDTTVGSSNTQAFDFIVTGGTISPTAITVTTSTANVFLKLGDSCTGLAISGTCTISVRFAPLATGLFSGTITLTAATDTSGTSKIVHFSGTAITATTPTATLAANAAGDHGTVTIGSSFAKTYTLTHGGGGEILTVTSVTVAAPFVRTADNCTGKLNFTSGTCTFEITYVPTAATTSIGVVTVVTNASNGTTLIISLTGTGAAAAATTITAGVSASSIDFGNVSVGTHSTATTVTVTNTGSNNLSVTSATITGATFTKVSDNCSGATIAASNTCTVQIQYRPTATGFSSGIITIVTNATDGTNKIVSLSGTGTTGTSLTATLSPSSISFGGTATGTSLTQVFTVKNTASTGNLNVASITGLAAPFILLGDTCTGVSVAVGGTCTFIVQFIPTASGIFADSLVVATNAGDGSNKIASIVGQTADITAGQILFTAPTYSFNNNVKTATVLVMRTGNGTGKVTADYRTVNGRASVADKDFEETTGTLTWESGDLTPKTINIPLPGTKFTESSRDFSIILSNITGGATLGTPGATTTNGVTITATPGVASIILYPSSGNSGGAAGGCSASGQPDISLGVLCFSLLALISHRRLVMTLQELINPTS